MAEHEFPSAESRPFDAIVDSFHDTRKQAPIAQDPAAFRLPVFVSGGSDTDTMGLADDVRMLIEAFVRDPASVDPQALAAAPASDADHDGDVEIALHGLNLGPEDERALHRLIRGLVAGRRATEGRER